MLKRFLNKACKNCDGRFCCHGKAYMTKAELKKIGGVTELPLSSFLEIEIIGDETYYMIKRKSNFCFFFDTKKSKCKIYKHRPLDCRLFPFTLEMKKNKPILTVNKNCILNVGSIDREITREIKVLIKNIPQKEMIKYAKYNLHNQMKKEIELGPLKT